jgi:uncharacterized protein YndB with AHSA1/START domain
VGGAHHRPPPGVHRLGHLPGQPGPHRRQHPPTGAPAGHRRGPRRLRPAPRAGHLRGLRPQARRLLRPAPQIHTRLLLHRHRRAGRRPRHQAPAGRRCRDRHRRRRVLPGRARPRRAAGLLAAAQQLEDGHDAALDQWRRQVEHARYQASRAERRYRAVDPENRLVARGLETDWEHALAELAAAEAELARRAAARPKTLTADERAAVLALGDDLDQVWAAATTTDKDRKQLLRTLLEEVDITVHRDRTEGSADLILRWKGGAISDLTVPLKRKPPAIRTDEDTIDLLRRLAVHYPDDKIAGILNRQARRTARGLSFTASRVQSLRHHWHIPCHQPSNDPAEGDPLTVADAAKELGLAPSTLHRWLSDGFIAGEQLTPGAPWRIRMNDNLRALFVDDAPDGWMPMLEATLAHGASRQTLLQRVKRGELRAVHVRTGRRKGLRIEPPTPQNRLF